jgi:hypothetical protein
MLIPRMATSQQPTTENKPFEDGDYLIECVKMETETAGYGKECISAEFVIIGPKYANKHLWKKFHINLDENNAAQKAYAQLNNIATANNFPKDSPNLRMENFIGWKATARLGASKTATGKEKINVIFFHSTNPDMSLVSDKYNGTLKTKSSTTEDDVDLPF